MLGGVWALEWLECEGELFPDVILMKRSNLFAMSKWFIWASIERGCDSGGWYCIIFDTCILGLPSNDVPEGFVLNDPFLAVVSDTVVVE